MLSNFIIKLRKEHGLSQELVSSRLSLSRPTYLQIERGERDLMLTEAQELAKLFNISFEDFLRQKETNFSISIEKENDSPSSKKENIRISVPQEQLNKFRTVLLYILRKVGGKPNIGMTSLYKLLYFIDFDYYEKHEEQLMGLVYIKNHYGPTPVVFTKVIDSMIKKGELQVFKSTYYKFPQTKYMINPEVEPDLSILNGQEKNHIDEELQRLSDMTASQLSDLSHRDVPWISAKDGQQLDYEAVFYRTRETSVRDY